MMAAPRSFHEDRMTLDLRFTDEENAFRQEVRDFIAKNLPQDIRDWLMLGHHATPDMLRRWTKILYDQGGWSTPGWPKSAGGPGWDAVRRYIFSEELQQAPAPSPLPFNAAMVGPVIYTFGNEAQKQRFLPRIQTLEDWWCQGFSEPGAGSDLASLKTSAKRDGDHYVVNGQKTWTSYAQYADWIFMLVRTDPEAKKQEGISFLLIDMKTPGITVRPIITIEGGHEVNEVFFDDVRVPVENLVGEENKGWDCAKFLLGNERMSIARVGTSKQRIRYIRELAAAEKDGDKALLENPRLAEKLTALEVELKALEITQLRVVAKAREGGNKPDPVTSVLKIKGSEIQQATSEVLMEVAAGAAMPFQPPHADGANEPPVGPEWAATVAPNYFNWRKFSIYGGSNEIQRTIIAKGILGL
jgi:pimeloyl-CoA dehydrogenase large subunit